MAWLKISTSIGPLYPAASTASRRARIMDDAIAHHAAAQQHMCGSGTSQSETWKPMMRERASRDLLQTFGIPPDVKGIQHHTRPVAGASTGAPCCKASAISRQHAIGHLRTWDAAAPGRSSRQRLRIRNQFRKAVAHHLPRRVDAHRARRAANDHHKRIRLQRRGLVDGAPVVFDVPRGAAPAVSAGNMPPRQTLDTCSPASRTSLYAVGQTLLVQSCDATARSRACRGVRRPSTACGHAPSRRRDLVQ